MSERYKSRRPKKSEGKDESQKKRTVLLGMKKAVAELTHPIIFFILFFLALSSISLVDKSHKLLYLIIVEPCALIFSYVIHCRLWSGKNPIESAKEPPKFTSVLVKELFLVLVD